MSLPVVVVTSGGLPVYESTTGYGLPVEVSTLPGALPVTIVISGGVPCVDTAGGIFLSLIDPVLTWVSGVEDNTPTLQGVFTDLQLNDVGRLQFSTDEGFTSPTDYTNTADDQVGEIDALLLAFTTGALADGAWWARVRHERGGAISAWSNVETKTIATASNILLEAGDDILLEAGDFLIMEAA